MILRYSISCSVLRLQHPCCFPAVLSSDGVTTDVNGHRFYDYYDFICNPSTHTSPSLVHLADLMAIFHSPHVDGSSPGKSCNCFVSRLPSLQQYVTERILDFGVCGRLVLHCCLTKVHFRLAGNSDYGFLQIPHWALLSGSFAFFGHPCLRLYLPSFQGDNRIFTDSLQPMPGAPPPQLLTSCSQVRWLGIPRHPWRGLVGLCEGSNETMHIWKDYNSSPGLCVLK